MLLSEYLRDYALRCDLRANTRMELEIVAKQFESFTGGKALADITNDDVDDWASSLLGRKVTVALKVSQICTLLKSARAFLRGRIGTPPQCVEAFTPEDVAKLLATAEALNGWFPAIGIRKADWWSAIIRTASDTELRMGDLLELPTSALKARGEVEVVQRVHEKTGPPVTKRLQAATWDAIQRVLVQGVRDRQVVFPWVATRHQFYVVFTKLAERAGVNLDSADTNDQVPPTTPANSDAHVSGQTTRQP